MLYMWPTRLPGWMLLSQLKLYRMVEMQWLMLSIGFALKYTAVHTTQPMDNKCYCAFTQEGRPLPDDQLQRNISPVNCSQGVQQDLAQSNLGSRRPHPKEKPGRLSPRQKLCPADPHPQKDNGRIPRLSAPTHCHLHWFQEGVWLHRQKGYVHCITPLWNTRSCGQCY